MFFSCDAGWLAGVPMGGITRWSSSYECFARLTTSGSFAPGTQRRSWWSVPGRAVALARRDRSSASCTRPSPLSQRWAGIVEVAVTASISQGQHNNDFSAFHLHLQLASHENTQKLLLRITPICSRSCRPNRITRQYASIVSCLRTRHTRLAVLSAIGQAQNLPSRYTGFVDHISFTLSGVGTIRSLRVLPTLLENSGTVLDQYFAEHLL